MATTQCLGYLGENGVLTDWYGVKIGTYIIVATWRTPRSYVSDTMHQVEACIDGVCYTGRSAGVGMAYTGRVKVADKPLPTKTLYARPVCAGGRKSCSSCHAPLHGEHIWSVGEYCTGKWRTVTHCCPACVADLRRDIERYRMSIRRDVAIVGYREHQVPAWLAVAAEEVAV